MQNNILNTKLASINSYLKRGLVPIIVNYKDVEYNGRIIKKKSPLQRGWNKINKKDAKEICNEYLNSDENYNIGILTGKVSNIIVIDLDVTKDDEPNGIDIIQKLEETNKNKIKTLIVETPSGGIHYYFRYENKFDRFKGTTKVGGYPIDIRTNGNQVIAPPSKYDNGEYKFINNGPINFMPDYLFEWLVVNIFTTSNKHQINPRTQVSYNDTNDYKPVVRIYDINENTVRKIKYMLYKLPYKYTDNYELWFKIGCCIKSIKSQEPYDLCNIFKEFSKRRETYDECKFMNDWLYKIKPKDDGLTLRTLFRFFKQENPDDKTNINIPYTIEFKPIDKFLNTNKFETINLDEQYVNKNHITEMLKNDIIMLKSATGSGKTTLFSYYLNEIKKTGSISKMLSIVSRVCMVEKQMADFNTIGVKMHSYKNKRFDYLRMICQVDSLIKLDPFIYKDCILFLDEIDSICNYFMSDTLKGKRCRVFDQFICLVRNAKYVFCCDADISDMSLQCIYDIRKPSVNQIINENMIFYWNKNKNATGKKAVIYNNYNNLKKIIMENNFKNNLPCLVAFDSKREMDKLVEECKNYCFTHKFLQQKDNILSYSCDEGDSSDFGNVNQKWTGKYVFFTPKIIYGLDFNSIKTDVYGVFFNRSINASQMVQQLTRCRNVDNLRIYIKDTYRPIKYHSLNEIPKNINDKIEIVEDLLGERPPHYNGIFLNLYMMKVYYDNIFYSKPKYHLIQLLKNKGFFIEHNDDKLDTDVKIAQEVENTIKTTNDKDISDIIDYINKNRKTLNIRQSNKYEKIVRRSKILKLRLTDLLNDNNKLLDIVVSDMKFQRHILYLKAKMSEEKFHRLYLLYNEYDEKMNETDFMKIGYIDKLEKILNIDRFQIEDINILDTHQDVLNLNDTDISTISSIQKFFKLKSVKIVKKLDLYRLLISIYKNTFGRDFVKGEYKYFKINGKCKKITLHILNY